MIEGINYGGWLIVFKEVGESLPTLSIIYLKSQTMDHHMHQDTFFVVLNEL